MASNDAGTSTSYTTLSESHVLQMLDCGQFTCALGTHDVLNVMALQTEERAITVTTVYSEHSTAKGALFGFVFITDSGDVDFGRSFLLALDRNTSHNHTLPFDLYPGHYRVYVYDIEHDGLLNNGVGYPAVTQELLANSNGSYFSYRLVS